MNNAPPEDPNTTTVPVAAARRRPLRAGLQTIASTARGVGWLGVWLPGALLALLLAAGVALWLWAATPGSLAHTLAWAQNYTASRADSTGVLTATDVQGSLRAGGQIGQLQWSRDGLTIKATGVRVRLGPDLWIDAALGRGLHVDALDIAQLEITDQRPPSPTEPLQALALPLALTLPWSVDELVLNGAQPLNLRAIQGVYRYGRTDAPLAPGVPDAHRLTLESLQVAGGRYRLQAALGAQTPMPLTLDVQGDVHTSVPGGSNITLQATAQASGFLSGPGATLDVSARVHTQTGADTLPTLSAQAQVMPWATQPLVRADITAHQLNLATLWPQAPVTALSGTLQAQPDGDAWRASVRLSNPLSGPADRQRLPLHSLQADVAQQGTRWTLSHLDAQLGGGRLQGDAQVQLGSTTTTRPAPESQQRTAGDTWQGDLRLSGINPALLWSTLAPAALDGTLTARTASTSGGQESIDLNALIQPSGRQPAGAPLAGLRLRELRVQGRWQPTAGDPTQGLLDLRDAQIQMADAQLQTSGQFDTTSRQFKGQLALQVPGAQAQWQGLLAHSAGEGNSRLQLDDAARLLTWVRSLQTLPGVGPPLRAWLDTQPGLAAQGSAHLTAQWQGGLGALGYPAPAAAAPTTVAPLPQLQATLNVPRLELQPDTSNDSTSPTTGISLSAWQLQADGRLDDLQLSAQGTVAQAPWSGELDTQGQLKSSKPGANGAASWQAGQLNLSRLQLRVSDASRNDRTTDWNLQNTQPLALQWQTTATGLRLDAGAGRLQLMPAVRRTASTQPPAPHLGTTPLSVVWDSLVWQANTLQTRGRLSDLPLAWAEVLGTAEGAKNGPLTRAGLSGNLVFDGQWDVLLPADGNTPLRLSASLQRSRGDLTVQTDGAPTSNGQRLQAGIQQAQLSLSVQGSTVQASLRWASERLGQASADLSTELTSRSAPASTASTLDHWWPASAPLRGTASAQLPQVGVWSALVPPGWRMRGTLQANAALAGTRGTPQWSGTLKADELGLRSVVDGFAFSNGQLRATLAGDKITIERFSLQGPRGTEPGGTLEATGTAEWRAVEGSALRQPFIELQATASKLRVSNRADRRLTLSGQLNAQLAGPKLHIRGQLTADSALFVLPDELAPTLSSDVVLRGTFSSPEDPDAVRVQPDVQVDLDLGEQFAVRGRGLQTRLSGQLSVRSTPAVPAPRVLGEVRTVSGTYRAYGQQLSIETGVLRFTGPYDDPTLDILAVRPQQGTGGQRVGVQISGSAQNPRVRLFSDPELPDSEKLAWLVLGRPATGAGAEAAVLQQAAMALLARNSSGTEGGLASSLGLDELGFIGQATNADGTTASAALTLGKRISNDLYLTYERSLAGTMGTVSIFYDVSRRLTLRARAGEENAVDLIFTVRYD
ncbi:MAG: translocation/assembly module TamB domain-containing protein [Hydrogenophaga sp.]|uniref:translocation/assembly module TamB domain-containing protein n=1 Tax=Hydrogenophaga sp. TaxID=1904254 RepID=UPI0027261960|nr:translocation/assembly module TamB domain-containing protein [Hydrogenophaga sp.]MDO9572181.1 translocation/assembly module TamB domain-containing protein [Hydrogenophaga sp.]MDP3373391.1 translocation/assembly module TamB domain-containing protein [Hydrogenophaga sp.]